MSAWKVLLRRPFLLIGALFLALAVSGFQPLMAEAAVGGCRADPVVILSDGTVLDVTADIQTSVENVTEISYIVHGPKGTKIVAVVSTPTIGFKGKEVFSYVNDAQPNQYITETLVRTSYNQVAVTAYTTFSSATLLFNISLTLQYKPIYGFNNQFLRATLKR